MALLPLLIGHQLPVSDGHVSRVAGHPVSHSTRPDRVVTTARSLATSQNEPMFRLHFALHLVKQVADFYQKFDRSRIKNVN